MKSAVKFSSETSLLQAEQTQLPQSTFIGEGFQTSNHTRGLLWICSNASTSFMSWDSQNSTHLNLSLSYFLFSFQSTPVLEEIYENHSLCKLNNLHFKFYCWNWAVTFQSFEHHVTKGIWLNACLALLVYCNFTTEC